MGGGRMQKRIYIYNSCGKRPCADEQIQLRPSVLFSVCTGRSFSVAAWRACILIEAGGTLRFAMRTSHKYICTRVLLKGTSVHGSVLCCVLGQVSIMWWHGSCAITLLMGW